MMLRPYSLAAVMALRIVASSVTASTVAISAPLLKAAAAS